MAEALLVPNAGIVNYAEVAAKLAEIIVRRGGEIAYGHQVEALREHATGVTVTAAGDTFEGRLLINCAGCSAIASPNWPVTKPA